MNLKEQSQLENEKKHFKKKLRRLNPHNPLTEFTYKTVLSIFHRRRWFS